MGYFMAKTVRFEEILPIQKMVDRLKLEELEDPSLRGGAFGTAYRVMPQDDFPIPGPGIMKVLELDPQPRQPQRGAAWLPDSWVKFREEYQRLFDMDGLTNEKGEVCAPRSYAWGYCSEATGSGKETWRAAIVMQEILPDEAEQLSKVLKTRKKFSPEAVAQFGKLATDIIARQSQATIPIAHRDLERQRNLNRPRHLHRLRTGNDRGGRGVWSPYWKPSASPNGNHLIHGSRNDKENRYSTRLRRTFKEDPGRSSRHLRDEKRLHCRRLVSRGSYVPAQNGQCTWLCVLRWAPLLSESKRGTYTQ